MHSHRAESGVGGRMSAACQASLTAGQAAAELVAVYASIEVEVGSALLTRELSEV